MISRIRHFLFDHALLKMASLLIAFLMWYGVSHDPVAEISMRVPIEFAHPPKGLDYNSDVLPQAQIWLRGPARQLRELPAEKVHAIIDLQGAEAGEHTYDLTTNEIRVPHNLEVIQVAPGRLRMVFDTRMTKQVPVRPRVVGAPPPGYRIAGAVADPSTIVITGPSRHVRAVENAVTDAIDASSVAGQASFESMAYVADPLVRVTSPAPVRVVVTTEKLSSRAGAP